LPVGWWSWEMELRQKLVWQISLTLHHWNKYFLRFYFKKFCLMNEIQGTQLSLQWWVCSL
jgi:hypothetical protein